MTTTNKTTLGELQSKWNEIHNTMRQIDNEIERKVEELGTKRLARHKYKKLKSMSEVVLKTKDDELEALKKSIITLKEKNAEMWKQSYWQDVIVKPLFDEVIKRFKKVKWDSKESYTSFGIDNRTPLYGLYKGKTILVEVKPHHLPNLEFNNLNGFSKLQDNKELLDIVELQINRIDNE